MCGLAGSSKLERAYTLYRLNLQRGSHSSGFLAISSDKNGNCSGLIEKTQGVFDLKFLERKIKDLRNVCNFSYFAFHSRAPTNSTETKWRENHTHPFTHDSYCVAHNGIITNFKDIPYNHLFEVDSSIIPYLLSKSQDISKTYSDLQGLLTSWIFNMGNFYVVKAGSSLWIKNCDFSSSEFDGATRIAEDGLVYKLENNELKIIDSFNYSNPYFI